MVSQVGGTRPTSPAIAPPTAPGALPLLGHTLSLLRDPLRFMRSLSAHGDVVAIRIGPFKAMVVCDPDLIHRLLIDDRTYDKGGLIFKRLREVVGNGVGTCPYRDHRRQRRLVQPAFHHERLPGYAEKMAGQVASVVGSWQEGQVIDVLKEVDVITTHVLGATLFASALSPAELEQALADIPVILGGVYRRTLMLPPLDKLPTRGNRHYDQALARMRATVRGIVAGYRAEPAGHDDLLSILLSSRDSESPGTESTRLSDEEICDQAMTFFLAGIETTSTTLAWALYLLSQHPGVEAQVQREADASPDPGYQDLPALVVTSRVITEALRLYPPVWFLTRVATKDTRLGRYRVRAGANYVYSSYVIHHRADVYPDPERFDPDRWAGEAAEGRPRGAFIPFGAGPRKCVGADFAITEAAIALAVIAARWKLEPVPGQAVRAAASFGLKPQALLMRVTARTPSTHQAGHPPAPAVGD